MIYRLYTEDKDNEQVEGILNTYFTGYTLIKARGVWQGVSEASLIIEIIGDYEPKLIVEVAEAIRIANDQQAVLVTSQECETRLVEAKVEPKRDFSDKTWAMPRTCWD